LGASEELLFCVGAWHLPPSVDVLKDSGQSFGGQKPGPRRMVLVAVKGPNALGFARSTTSETGIIHDAHSHADFTCRIDVDGSRVVVGVRVRIAAAKLDTATYSCLEPDGTELNSYLDQWRHT
jgi:hypothetical protein